LNFGQCGDRLVKQRLDLCILQRSNLCGSFVMLEQLKQKALEEITKAESSADLGKVEQKYLGRQGELTEFLRSLGTLPEQERKEKGRLANQLKKELAAKISEAKKKAAGQPEQDEKDDWLDITAPGENLPVGHFHPLSLVQKEIEDIFQSMGFSVVYGPEMETEYYNFDALNIPKDHPARDVWDTFWLKDLKTLLRTHTSPVQARYMEKHQPPLRIIAPGRCFRHEATDASHEAQFHQVEGLMIGTDISLSNLKAVLEAFMKRFYGPDVKLRWQPSYFPFVEPGLELLMECKVCKGKGCSTCGQTGWIEVIPCGMVHSNVFKTAGYPISASRRNQGFAFGMGLDRLAMMKYKIDDIRLLYSSDLRFINQF